MGPLIPLLWTCSDVSSGFQIQSGQPSLCLAEVYVLHVLSSVLVFVNFWVRNISSYHYLLNVGYEYQVVLRFPPTKIFGGYCYRW